MDEEKNLNEAAEEITEAAENVVDDAADTAAEAAENVVNDAAEAVETVVEKSEDAAENAVEAITDAADDAAVDAAEDVAETAETVVDGIGETAEYDENETQIPVTEPVDGMNTFSNEIGETVDGMGIEAADTKKKSKGTEVAVIAVCAVIVAAIIVLAAIFIPKIFHKNPYNKYIDTTGRTVGEIAEMSGMELDEFLESNSLPADMPADTNESSAFNAIPIGKVLEMYQYENMATVDEAKSFLALPDWVDENTPWGEAVGEAPLKNFVGEENLEAFLEHYGLQDTANGDTLYKDVRQTVDAADQKERIEYEKQMEELQKQMEAQQSQSDDQAQTEAPADDQAQTEQTADDQAPAEQTDAADTEAQPAQ